jgi:hypothetical protein
MSSRVFVPFVCAVLSQILVLLIVSAASAQLKFYYDPASGNVSFDTSDTRSGGISLYYFGLNGKNPDFPSSPQNPPWEFRTENLIRLSQSTFFDRKPRMIGEGSLASTWRGLYTIGDVFPVGLSEEFWTTSFVRPEDGEDPRHGAPFIYGYTDGGLGYPPLAEFIYGRPDGDFKNKWDLVDPATLNWATAANLVYLPSTGEVIVDTTVAGGGYFSALILESANMFNANGFDPFFRGPYVDATDSLVGLFGDAFEPGRYSLGNILPNGLTRAEFEAVFERAEFLGRAGFKSQDFNFEAEGLALSLRYVPEPSTLILLTIACGAMTLRRRKHPARLS